MLCVQTLDNSDSHITYILNFLLSACCAKSSGLERTDKQRSQVEKAGQEQSRQMAKSRERMRQGEQCILGNLASVESCCETRESGCYCFILLNIFSHSPELNRRLSKVGNQAALISFL